MMWHEENWTTIAGFEDGKGPCAKECRQPLEAKCDSLARGQGSQSHKSTEINSANNLNDLRSRFFCRTSGEEHSSVNTLNLSYDT